MSHYAPATPAPPTVSQSTAASPAAAAQRTPPIAWLVPLAAVVAVVGAIMPWFEPIVYTKAGHQPVVTTHSWEAGRFGVLGPVLLVIIGVIVLRRLLSTAPGKAGKNPVRTAGMLAALFALLTLGLQFLARLVVLAAVEVTSTDSGASISLSKLGDKPGIGVSRGTQLGFWITAVAAAIALIGGIAMMIAAKWPVADEQSPAPYAAPAVPTA